MTRRNVSHTPVWQPTMLRYNAAGDTKPGFECVHPLENGNGLCRGNVFTLDQEVGDHACVVDEPEPVVEIPVFEMPTTYTVSALPLDHEDAPDCAVNAVYEGAGRWSVRRGRRCLDVDGRWHIETSDDRWDGDWLASHRFDLDTALSMAREAAPNVRVNGRTAREVAAEIGATP